MKRIVAVPALAAFAVIVTVVFWAVIETGVRYALYAKTGDSAFLTYGLVTTVSADNEKHERVFDAQGNQIYWKCRPSDNPRNPVNRLGFRGPDIMAKKPETIRVMCFGGSTTYGLCLPYADTYPKLLQDVLDSEVGSGRFEVINAGFSAYKFKEIIALYEHEALSLEPDIVVILSVFNNLVSYNDENFYFIRVEGDGGNHLARWGRQIIRACSKYSLLVKTFDDIAQKGARNFLRNFNWEQGVASIMRNTGLWDTMAADLHRLFALAIDSNAAVNIIVVDEPMNFIDYPELVPPMEKAYQVQRDVCMLYDNVYHIELMATFLRAQRDGQEIWHNSYFDPIHLSREGNALLASVLAERIVQLY